MERRSFLKGIAAAALLAVAPSLPKFGYENPILSKGFGIYRNTLFFDPLDETTRKLWSKRLWDDYNFMKDSQWENVTDAVSKNLLEKPSGSDDTFPITIIP